MHFPPPVTRLARVGGSQRTKVTGSVIEVRPAGYLAALLSERKRMEKFELGNWRFLSCAALTTVGKYGTGIPVRIRQLLSIYPIVMDAVRVSIGLAERRTPNATMHSHCSARNPLFKC